MSKIVGAYMNTPRAEDLGPVLQLLNHKIPSALRHMLLRQERVAVCVHVRAEDLGCCSAAP